MSYGLAGNPRAVRRAARALAAATVAPQTQGPRGAAQCVNQIVAARLAIDATASRTRLTD